MKNKVRTKVNVLQAPDDKDLHQFCEGLKEKQRFILTSHVNPEGDAVACVLAMDSLLQRLGKKSLVISEDPFPERLSVLPSKRWNQISNLQRDSNIDALVVCDCPTLERIGQVREWVGPNVSIFNLDHHITNEKFGHYNYVQPTAAACGEVVFDVFRQMQMPLTKDEATALYVSIVTDTGSFKGLALYPAERHQANDEGRFQVTALPGPGIVTVRAVQRNKFSIRARSIPRSLKGRLNGPRGSASTTRRRPTKRISCATNPSKSQ